MGAGFIGKSLYQGYVSHLVNPSIGFQSSIKRAGGLQEDVPDQLSYK
jgi:hypothetical protein